MLGKKKRRIWLPLAVLLAGTVVAALDARLAVRHYRLETARCPHRSARPAHRLPYAIRGGPGRTAAAVAREGPDVVLQAATSWTTNARMDPERAYTAASLRPQLAHLLCLGQPRVQSGRPRQQDRAGGRGETCWRSVRPRGRGRADHTALRHGRRRRGSGLARPVAGPRRADLTFSPYADPPPRAGGRHTGGGAST